MPLLRRLGGEERSERGTTGTALHVLCACRQSQAAAEGQLVFGVLLPLLLLLLLMLHPVTSADL